ncbi:MAG: archease [Prochloraceae cyanobacterium]|nr:archease [Prochloraceae cyanobacterium]
MGGSKSNPAKSFEEIEHTADRAYRVRGKNLRELFVRAARGLYSLVEMQLKSETKTVRSIELEAIDPESLLVAWLNELLYLHESEGLGFDRIQIDYLDRTSLKATVQGTSTRKWLEDIKAVTYHNLSIRETESGLEVTLVLDV